MGRASARLIGAIALALPLALTGRLRLTSAAVPFLVASGLAEVAGFFSYTWGSRHGLAIAAVLSSQFAVVALAVSYVLFGERLSRVQLAGVACVVIGVAALERSARLTAPRRASFGGCFTNADRQHSLTAAIRSLSGGDLMNALSCRRVRAGLPLIAPARWP